MGYFYDEDLNPVLQRASDTQLEPIKEILLKKASNFVDCDENYKKYPDHPTKYVRILADEIRTMGGSTLGNLFRRGEGVSYKEVVCDVLDWVNVYYDKTMPARTLEEKLLIALANNPKLGRYLSPFMSVAEISDILAAGVIASCGILVTNPCLPAMPMASLLSVAGFWGPAYETTFKCVIIVANLRQHFNM